MKNANGKKVACCVLMIFILIFLVSTCVTIGSVSAQPDFDAVLGNPIAESDLDGTIGAEWNDASSYTNIGISPKRNAEFWIKHDGANLYLAMRFTADCNNPWVALQLGNTGCHNTICDGAIFGSDSYASDGYKDISFQGSGSWYPTSDSCQDGCGAMSISSSNVVTVEMKKPLNCGDSEGEDMAWSCNNEYSLVVAYDSNGGGSSGGSESHTMFMPTLRTVRVSPDPIPEVPGVMFVIILLGLAVPVVIIKRLQPSKHGLPKRNTFS
jgi:hypothetical protein